MIMNKELPSVFFVESPFQLISAIEAANHFGTRHNFLLINYSRFASNNRQIDALLSFFKWDRVIKFKYRFFRSFTEFLIIPYVARMKKTKFRYVFIGEPRQRVLQTLLYNLAYEDAYLLDDGNITPLIQKIIEKERDLRKTVTKLDTVGNTIRELYYKLWRIDEYAYVPNWFTCFNIPALNEEQQIVKNEFLFFKTLNNKERKNTDNLGSDVFFIGGRLAESGIISEEDEIEFVKQIADYYYKSNGVKMYYCVHRRESEEKLAKLATLNNVRLRRAEFPLEVDLLVKGERVNFVCTFFSSALHTLKLIINPNETVIFELPEASIIDFFKEKVNVNYAFYRDEGYQFSDLLTRTS